MTELEMGFARTMQNAFPKESRFLLAVSGGLDSTVLTALSAAAGLSFDLAHCHFGLRGEESDRDASFVQELARRYGVRCYLKNFDTLTYSTTSKISIQEAARALRYEWFDELLNSENYTALLLAHHANDAIETVLMHFFRGTGLKGLTGIPARNGSVFRPLLDVRREELEAYARLQDLTWVEDSSNSKDNYTRNFFRNQLLPQIAKLLPAVVENLMDNRHRFLQTYQYLQLAVEKDLKSMVEQKGNELRIPVRKFKKSGHPVLLYELVKRYGFGEKQLPDIYALLDADSGKFIANEKYQVVKHGLWLYITPVNKEEGLFVIDEETRRLETEGFTITIERVPAAGYSINPSPGIAQFDASLVHFPLVLRKWKAGDYFYPLGMKKKKKVARFLIDARLPKQAKEQVWVLQSNQRLVWVAGMRIDERFRITAATREILLLTYKRKVLGR